MSDNTEVTKEVEVNPEEAKASESGWVPKDKWVEQGNDPDSWRSAREFNERGEFFKTIHTTKSELKRTQSALTALQRHHQYVFEKAHQKAINDLRKEKRQAMQQEDFQRVEEIDAEIEQANREAVQTVQTLNAQAQEVASAGTHPEFQVWMDRNQWYVTDGEMREFAEAAGLAYFSRNPKANPQEVLAEVEKKVKKAYPEKFGIRKTAPNPVAASDKSTGASKKSTPKIQLDDLERQIADTLVRSGVMTEEQYIAELQKVKG